MEKNILITNLTVDDIRFPTSRYLDGSDAMNKDPDYSAAYITLHTNVKNLKGNGLTFTIGRGNEICVVAIRALSPLIVGKSLDFFTNNMGNAWGYVTGDSQLRWIGPDKGAIHLATGAVINALWDLWAKVSEKPLWKLISDMSPDELVKCIDFSYITDVLTKQDALSILEKKSYSKNDRVSEILKKGYPAYTTSVGWLGYSDEKLSMMCRQAVKDGWDHIKLKVGENLEDDIRRCRIARDIIGKDRKLMIDANQKWEVSEAINWIKSLKEFDPWFIEEPTSPDDILGHRKIKEKIYPIRVASGEMCQNRIIFKQFIENKSLDVVQIDSCRLGGVNEVLAVYLMAAKFKLPVCPHAGGVGLCEYVQHLAMADYISISGSTKNRVLEYVDHLHDHFIDPVVVEDGYYKAPQNPGYSISMHPGSIEDYKFPDGKKWK